jgi:AcrR family transcriptional regulator
MSEHSMKRRASRTADQPADTTLTSREQQAIARRAQIVETALRLFARHGFDGTSTKQIAEAAGITEGLIFHYFPTKAHLLTAVIDTRHSFLAELRAFLEGAVTQSAADVLPRLARSWLTTLHREAAITAVLFGTAQTNPEVGAALRGLIDEGTTRLAMYLRTRMQAGELRADLPVESSAQMFFASLMIFFVVHRFLPTAEWQQRADAFTQDMLSIWFDGARA